jgi:hypothetical protein
VSAPLDPPPDTKDWTFVIEHGCADCGFTPQPVEQTGARLRATLPAWEQALRRPDASTRPSPQIWSPVEYACHVRDTCELFGQRLELMLNKDDPVFENWDQDVTAIEDDYFHQDPSHVLEELTREATATAAAFDAVRADEWDRPGRRSNGSVFTIATFAVYFLHDVEHHVWDVSGEGWMPFGD